MLSVENLNFAYNKNNLILKNIKFHINEGVLCILGPNGAGKSTLLKCILGFNNYKSGLITIDNIDLKKLSIKDRSKYISYVPQSSIVSFPFKSWELIMMGRVSKLGIIANPSKEDFKVVNSIMEKLGILKLRDKNFLNLSGGERQMVLIARALSQESKYIVLDEPTSNLDYSNQIKILSTIKSLSKDGYKIIMTSHFPDHAFLTSSKVLMLKNGSIENFGSPESIVNTKNLSNLYDAHVSVSEAFIDDLNKSLKTCIPIFKEEF